VKAAVETALYINSWVDICWCSAKNEVICQSDEKNKKIIFNGNCSIQISQLDGADDSWKISKFQIKTV
jgi:hypothetical protein